MLRKIVDTLSLDDFSLDPPVRGCLHTPAVLNGNALVLTHGAGTNRDAPLLVALAEAFAASRYNVLRCDLPFRQERRTGPMSERSKERDRAGLRNAIMMMKKMVRGTVFLGGHSYGGRQASMLCATEPELVSGLLLLSYPLHPPRKPEQLRTQHLPNLRTPSLFVHGTRDPFGSIGELEKAVELIPAKTTVLRIDGGGHDLGFKKGKSLNVPGTVLAAFSEMFR